ncbi:hypothetical protein LOC67_10770 [Stieleria sp. JC731]|uniref:hypothetical protein n=1 Tax=Pirellulaceae TaxID=2691357 RepID=UPI001E317518|nr:hypothetical protein [Stieleria sp. JC731]MCC9601028.1 hypothetical protein [Stieleria sp. JC731]
MHLDKLLQHEHVNLPTDWKKSHDFEGFLTVLFQNYLSAINDLAPCPVKELVAKNATRIENLADSIKQTVALFFDGHPQDAYSRFEEAIKAVLPELNSIALKNISATDLGFTYRVRVSDTPLDDPKALFHIPFELRSKVGTQRYSIPGLPCLYLGGSLYTCWEEMGRPPLHKLYCSAFWLACDRPVKILNLSNRPARLALYTNQETDLRDSDPGFEFIVPSLILWPLIAACSIRVKDRGGPFKPEYIVPQLLLQWITKNEGFDGVCYFSTHVSPVFKTDARPACNFVFPAQVKASNGMCEFLRSSFRMTKPYGWEFLDSFNFRVGPGGHLVPTVEAEFIEGSVEPYYNSKFGMIETKLNQIADRILIAEGYYKTDAT